MSSVLAITTCLLTGTAAPAVAQSDRNPGKAPHRPSGNGAVSAVGEPLTSAPGPGESEEAGGPSPQGEADPLVSNGLGSPLCKGALGPGALSSAAARDCDTSGFVAAAAPTGDYGIDVHIDTGVLGVSAGGLLSAVQDLFVTPVWMALVWIAHALVVMLEWCFTIDLLDSPAAAGIGRGLRQAQASFTQPWLALVLSLAAIVAAYDGLVRRRVAETLGQVALMAVMIAGGIWVILDPAGTVGALGSWANRASLGTLAVAARGNPTGPARVLSESMDTVFTAAIEAPWCYLEFGNVGWCRDTRRLDPRLREAGLRIAAAEIASVGCDSAELTGLPCAARGSAPARGLEHSAQLLREAHSNGAIFLALPANGPARNSINEKGSLLRTLCASSEADGCRGPTAAEAEFRTGGQTMARVGGLLLIAAGMLGMMLLLGFLALRLLTAAIFSLLYLLLAPAVVLAPALGESGRALFRSWLAQLLGSVLAKLVFSFLLGAVLAVLAVLASLEALGWWTQWLLMSAFWWGAYLRRHHVLAVTGGAIGREQAAQRSVTRRVSDVLETRRGMALARWAGGRRRRGITATDRTTSPPSSTRAGLTTRSAAANGRPDAPTRMFERERSDAEARLAARPELERRNAPRREQLGRLRNARAQALARGERRRAAELGHRGARVAAALDRERRITASARDVADGGRAGNHGRDLSAQERVAAHARFLAAQANLKPANRARSAADRRDYRAMAALAGLGREEYDGLTPHARRAARATIDRELAAWRGQSPVASRTTHPGGGAPRAKDVSDGEPRSVAESAPRGRPAPPRSVVMDDAREVAAGRKRQLGRDRP